MIKNIGETVADISNKYEQKTDQIKKDYLRKNIETFRELSKKLKTYQGTFGTGYPFYAIDPNFKGELPLIDEQIRYNEELRQLDNARCIDTWACEDCLRRNCDKMPDLKQICKPCTKMADGVKPRKVINRLPDIDMWFVSENGKVEESKVELAKSLKEVGFRTSDINPVGTIYDMGKIVEAFDKNRIPKLLLPVDAHIVTCQELIDCLQEVPNNISKFFTHNEKPYVPIHPFSLRKTWQKDDVAYDFVHDFLSSLTEDDFNGELKDKLKAIRKLVASAYSIDELYEVLLITGNDATRRRHKNKSLRKCFDERVKSWKK